MELEWRPGGNAQFLQRIVESVQLMRKIHRLIVYSSSFYKKHEIPALKKNYINSCTMLLFTGLLGTRLHLLYLGTWFSL